MKNAELRRLVEEYKILKAKLDGGKAANSKILEKIREIEHRYFHETGQELSLS